MIKATSTAAIACLFASTNAITLQQDSTDASLPPTVPVYDSEVLELAGQLAQFEGTFLRFKDEYEWDSCLQQQTGSTNYPEECMQIMVEEVAWWFREKTAEIDLHDYLANFGINPSD